MSSSAGRLPSQAEHAYTVAKAGIIMLTRNVANDVGKFGVRLNCVAPGAILTERTRGRTSEEQRQQVAAMHPLSRWGTPEDVALATLFLASESAGWLTGVTLDVAGGRIML
jgi:3-oxoacyl-[acyl-carrier protein] reductase